MGKFKLRRGDVKTIKNHGKAHSEKRRFENDENTLGKLNRRKSDVKTMKILWEISI